MILIWLLSAIDDVCTYTHAQVFEGFRRRVLFKVILDSLLTACFLKHLAAVTSS
jgi:hypothetical protein